MKESYLIPAFRQTVRRHFPARRRALQPRSFRPPAAYGAST